MAEGSSAERLLLGLGRRSGRGRGAARLGARGCRGASRLGARGRRGAAGLGARGCLGAASSGSTPGAGTTSPTWTAASSPRPAATAATSAEPPTAAELAARAPIHPWDLGLALGQAGLEGGVPRPLVADPHVIELQLPLQLPPSAGQQMAMPACGRLAQLVGVRDLQEEALDPNFLVLGHWATG